MTSLQFSTQTSLTNPKNELFQASGTFSTSKFDNLKTYDQTKQHKTPINMYSDTIYNKRLRLVQLLG